MKKRVIIIICILIVILGLGIFFLTKGDAKTSLNVIERKWIDNNKKVLQDISIYTDVPIFSYSSDGIIFDYLKSLEHDTGLEFNKLSYNVSNQAKSNYAFMVKDSYDNKDILMYTDNYVLVTKNGVLYNEPTEIKNITVGILNNTLDIVNNCLLGADATYKTFADYKSVIASLGVEVDAIVIPKVMYLKDVLTNKDYVLSYNISEYKVYYVLHLGDNNTLNSILTKYYKKWSKTDYQKSFNNYLLSIYFTSTDEGAKNVAKLKSKRYIYGFVNEQPYDLISNSNFIGINNAIMADFSNSFGLTLEYKEFNTVDELMNAFNTNAIDVFFNNNREYDYNLDVFNTLSPYNEKLVILTKNNSNSIINGIVSLKDSKVAVLKNSKIADYLKKYEIDIQEFDSMKKLMNDKKISIKAIDNYNYEYYINKGINGYHKSYETFIDQDYFYTFRSISDNKDFANFFNFYLSFIPTKLLIENSLIDSLNTNNIMLLIKISIILMSIILIGFITLYVVNKILRKKGKRINLSKEDKLKYVDMLTSLKNRNYLNDNIELWDESEVYPQTIIVIDLNNIAYINDNYGHSEGDLVIKEAASILIRNQNPNSEIIRTNGNEFLIYLVNYDEKQVLSYIKKLSKEFKELPHGFGAAIGYSVITDAIKTVDDAINEATIDMRNNKEESKD